MATVKVKWRPSTIDGKAGTIYYQIIHNRVVRQLKTDYKIFAEEWNDGMVTFSMRPDAPERINVLSTIQERICGDLKHMNKIIEKFDNRNRSYDVYEIITAFTNRSREQSFFNFMQHVIAKLKQLNKERTAENYTTTLNSFAQFRKYQDLLPREIDSDIMQQYEAYLIGRGITKNTISFYMRVLRAVYNRAVEQGLTAPRSPFRRVYTGVDKTAKRALSFASIKRIKGLDLSQQPTLAFARDMFLFSFYTRGMSFIDMAYLRKRDLKNGFLSYRRCKTGQQLSIKWETYMQEIVKKYETRTEYPNSPYLLPILKYPFDNSQKQYRCAMQQINRSLKTIARFAELDVPLTMYVARHSWASIAHTKNIPVSVISEGMGHHSEVITRIYLSSLDSTIIDQANSIIMEGL